MTTSIDPYSLTSGDVARVLGVSVERVRQLDAVLRPKRRASGRRFYHPRRVRAVANQRARASA